jgi:hypothetical protein
MFHSRKIVTDYSALMLHPTWRAFGGLVSWGGGHSATNYNGVNVLTFDTSTIYWECVQAPHNWTADLNTGDLTSEIDATYGEVTGSSPLKRIAGHTYGSCVVVGGKLIQIANQAAGYLQDFDGVVAHELDLTNPATSYNSRAWVRRTNSTGNAGWTWESPPVFAVEAPALNKLIAMARGGGGPYSMQWYDLATDAWVTGTGTGFSYPEAQTDGGDPTNGGLVHVPSRDLVIGAWRVSGNLVLHYASVASGTSQPTVAGSATLSAALAIPVQWGAITWCSDSNRLLVFGVTSNTDKVYEIEIPTTLTDTWTVTSHTLAGAATIVPQGKGEWSKSCQYNPLTKCCAFFQSGLSEAGNDVLTVYRPRNT